ncbi:hypothetical protein CEXT_52311 [Caerostris extrusa]|uniref:RNase H type-1 domain-containing protein n=1 Tax=Caerostris extrusa TaxID=172846 RepID=A0AAV4Y395_CAEEX|nr:hypothetical protein CEXT_52311 [Caerostris extrusa]
MTVERQTNQKIFMYFSTEILHLFFPLSLLPIDEVSTVSIPEIFSFYVPVGRDTSFDHEIAVILTALSQLQCHLEKFTRAVILCDSRAALLAIVFNNIPKTQTYWIAVIILKTWHHSKKL